jgi:hypothetical protein
LKKARKNFCLLGALAPAVPTPPGAKVFWLLFFKKVTASFRMSELSADVLVIGGGMAAS